MSADPVVLQIAVPTPFRKLFDYLPENNANKSVSKPGCRVLIPFGKRKHIIGVVVSSSKHSEYPQNKLKRIEHVIDEQPVFEKTQMELLLWASRYYHHPVGEVINNALPVWLRKANQLEQLVPIAWQMTKKGKNTALDTLKRSPKQYQLLEYLQKHSQPHLEHDLLEQADIHKRVIQSLEQKQFIEKTALTPNMQYSVSDNNKFDLNQEQKQAVKNVTAAIGSSQVFLLDGLTGSGKTEVYMEIVKAVLQAGKQSLILLPEIGLTPQIIQRFKQRFHCKIAIQHSGLSNRERMQHWLSAKDGSAGIVLGTRSAIWTPLANPGVFIIDEEHDLSYKQQEGFRYSAKDTLIMRSQLEQLPVLLGSATPSLESQYNIQKKSYQPLQLRVRAGGATLPEFKLFDVRGKKMYGALSDLLVNEIRQHLNKNNQVLLFLNRRGYATHLICHACGWKACCERCERPYTYHKTYKKMICHHCDNYKNPIETCAECEQPLFMLGHGTERIEEQLHALFPDKTMARIDRDSTRKKNAMSSILEKINDGSIDILIGTQMLAKGHHFPNVTLTAIVDADHGLFSTDFRASERLAQLFVQVSGRAGRGEKKGTVVVQTHQPDHDLFQQIIQHGYQHYAKTLMQERETAELPPYSYMALLNAEAHNQSDAVGFLRHAAVLINERKEKQLSVFGPVPALIEKRSGRFRQQLILQANNRNALHKHIDSWLLQLETAKLSKKVRWSIDIDPQDMA